MVSLAALWLPILLSAVVVFIASSLFHMVLPFHRSDYRQLPDEDKLRFIGFFNQHTAVDVDTGNQVNIILTMQPGEKNAIPLIFDIDAACRGNAESNDWQWILSKILSLRSLKNKIFENTLDIKQYR